MVVFDYFIHQKDLVSCQCISWIALLAHVFSPNLDNCASVKNEPIYKHFQK